MPAFRRLTHANQLCRLRQTVAGEIYRLLSERIEPLFMLSFGQSVAKVTMREGKHLVAIDYSNELGPIEITRGESADLLRFPSERGQCAHSSVNRNSGAK